MTINPCLARANVGEDLIPALLPSEAHVLRRPGVQFQVNNVHTSNSKWSAFGTLYLTNIRIIFVADKAHESGLLAFDLPLVYVRNDVLNQPIFGCNNLSGEVWSTSPDGGPNGTLPPHQFYIYFKQGGIGTFYPLYYTLSQRAKAAIGATLRPVEEPNPISFVNGVVNRAFVDPNDPSIIYLTQPLDESTRLKEVPRYAATYGQDEKYEDMGLRP